MKNFIISMIRAVWYFVALLVVFTAIMVVLARALTPLLNDHRSEIERWASHVLYFPVQIGSLEAKWQGFQPDLLLNNVTIYSKDHQQVLLSVKNIQFDIDIFKSIQLKELQPTHLEVSGVHFTIHQDKEGHFKIQGLKKTSDSEKKEPQVFNFQHTLEWLFARQRITLKQIKVDWQYEQEAIVPLNLNELNFVNQEEEHYINGYATILQKKQLAQLHFRFQFRGKVNEWEKSQATLYIKANNLNLETILSKQIIQGYKVNQGFFNGQLWYQWSQGHWQSLQSIYDVKNLNLTIPQVKESITINHALGHLALLPFEDKWRVVASFADLDLKAWNKIPAFENLSGNVEVQSDKGVLNLDSNRVRIDFDDLFPTLLVADHLHAQLHWNKQYDDSWIIKTDDVSIDNQHAAIHGKFSLLLPKDYKRPVLNLMAGFDINDATEVKYYFPIRLFSKELTNWLNHAFVSGSGASGTVLIQGALDDFPFDHHNGTFVVDSTINDLDFHFAPNWPDVNHMKAHLVFQNRTMTCTATQGESLGLHLNQGDATISSIGTKGVVEVLHLNLSIKGEAEQGLFYLHHSPLESSVGHDVSLLRLKGDTAIGLKLKIPLAKTANTTLHGDILFKDNQLTIPTWDVVANHLKGNLYFTEKDFSSDLLQANLFNEPSIFSVKTIRQGKAIPFTQVKVRSQTSLSALEKHFKLPENPYIHGSSKYEATLNLRTSKKDSRQSELIIGSGLEGVAIDLPHPFFKKAETSVPFNIHLWLGDHQPPQALLTFEKCYSAALTYHLVNNKADLWSVNLHFGSVPAKFYSEKGFFINGYLPTFDLKTWQEFIANMKKKPSSKTGFNIDNVINQFFKTLDVKIGHINILGQLLRDARIKLQSFRNTWSLSIDNVLVEGNLYFAKNLPQKSITGTFKRLFLQSTSAPDQTKIDPGKIPALDIVADAFQYGDQYYGAVHVITEQQQHALRLKRCVINSPLIAGDITGSWEILQDGNYRSNAKGELTSGDVTKLLKSWNFKSSLLARTGEVKFDLHWSDALTSPKLKLLMGDVIVRLNKGYIVDIGDKANDRLNLGRLLSLLSINRFLFMHFEDLTHKGYGFDTMRGHFYLQNGLLTIKSMFFDGSVAKMDITGSLNVIDKSLDLALKVTPYITSSLPVIATLAGGPIAGAVTWVADKMVGKQVSSKYAKYSYKVTGSWFKPTIVETGGSNKS